VNWRFSSRLGFYAPHRTGSTARFLQALAAGWLDRKSTVLVRSQFKLTECARGNVTTRALPGAGLGAAGFASLKNSVSEVNNSRLIPRGSAWKSGYVEAIEFILPLFQPWHWTGTKAGWLRMSRAILTASRVGSILPGVCFNLRIRSQSGCLQNNRLNPLSSDKQGHGRWSATGRYATPPVPLKPASNQPGYR